MPYKDGRSKAARRKAARKFTYYLSEKVLAAIDRGPLTGRQQQGVILGAQPGWNAKRYGRNVQRLNKNSKALRKVWRERKLAGRMWAVVKSEARRSREWHGTWVKGCVNAESAWVRLLTVLEPGHWYGTLVIDQLVGRRHALFRLNGVRERYFEKALNPAFKGHAFRFARGPRAAGQRFEPKVLYRLNEKGARLRAAALAQPVGLIELAKIG